MAETDRGALVRDCRQISIQLELLFSRAIAQTGLTASQAWLLLYILRHSEGGVILTEIHRTFGYSKASLSSTLKHLREKGYVRVEHCAGDDRRKVLFGTEKGLQVQEFLDRSFREAFDRLYRGFSPPELSLLDQLQKRVLHNLSTLMKTNDKEASAS